MLALGLRHTVCAVAPYGDIPEHPDSWLWATRFAPGGRPTTNPGNIPVPSSSTSTHEDISSSERTTNQITHVACARARRHLIFYARTTSCPLQKQRLVAERLACLLPAAERLACLLPARRRKACFLPAAERLACCPPPQEGFLPARRKGFLPPARESLPFICAPSV